MIKNCHLCNKDFHIISNLLGLVINDSIFVCPVCLNNRQESKIRDLIEKQPESNCQSIGLWLCENRCVNF